MSLTIGLINCNRCTCLFLHLLDNLTTRTNDCTDEFLRNIKSLNTWNLWFEFGTRLGYRLKHAVQNMLTACLCLHQCLLKDFEWKAVALDIHLSCGQTITCTSGFEVHIAQVILISEDIAKDSIFVFSRVLDESHSDTTDGFLHWNTCVHQGQCTGTYRCHWWRTIRFEDLAD